MMAQSEAAVKAAGGVSTADELAKLTQLRDSGALTIPEYEALRAKLLTLAPLRRPSPPGRSAAPSAG